MAAAWPGTHRTVSVPAASGRREAAPVSSSSPPHCHSHCSPAGCTASEGGTGSGGGLGGQQTPGVAGWGESQPLFTKS